MPKRQLRVVNWLSTTPVIGVCDKCLHIFKVPMHALMKTKDAEQNMREQFDRHICKPTPK
jgi:hypothetical protein